MNDIVDLLDQQGQYGSAESLNYLGIQRMQGSGSVKRDFKVAKEFFEKAIKIEETNVLANFELGVIYMLGLGTDKDIQTAVEYFKKAGNDAHSYNALGVIYYEAPDVFERDPVLLHQYGSVRKDIKLAKSYFEKAATSGNLNAKYNSGVLWLQEDSDSEFSYSKAYENFKTAASKGHTMSSYNLAVMNFLGLGTYKSCKLSLTFFKHVVGTGEHSQLMKQAFRHVQKGQYLQATFQYMQLAEMGFGVASLNLALILERANIFASERSALGMLA